MAALRPDPVPQPAFVERLAYARECPLQRATLEGVALVSQAGQGVAEFWSPDKDALVRVGGGGHEHRVDLVLAVGAALQKTALIKKRSTGVFDMLFVTKQGI